MNDSDRIVELDVLRGVAVLGILLINVALIALPDHAALNPRAAGGTDAADLVTWAIAFIIADGKMRALFAMLLGASTLLVMERAEMAGHDGASAHRARMLWLIPIGLAHHLLLWDGDILLTLAIAGLIAARFVQHDPQDLVKWAFGLIGLQLLISGGAVLWPMMTLSPRAFDELAGAAATAGVATDSWPALVAARALALPHDLWDMARFALVETLAFILIGMAMTKAGFLTGQWDAAQYRQTMRHVYQVGLTLTAALGVWTLMTGNPLVAQANIIAWAMPLHLPVAVGHAALVMLIVSGGTAPAMQHALAAVGRLALSNYLLSSVILTSLFYGYGMGWFGALDRVALLAVVGALWAALVLWSLCWTRFFRHGPAEWLWRSLVRGQAQPIRLA